MIRATVFVALLMLACLTNGCAIGMTARDYRPALAPKGVMMQVETAQHGMLPGELIEVRDSGIILLASRKLHLVPYTEILSSTLDQTASRYSIKKRTAPQPRVQEYLRMLSRFPQGLTPELMRELLSEYGQTELAGTAP